MRFELAGSLIRPDPLVLRFDAAQSFVPETYVELGFTHFEVICIGGGGGHGGGIDTANTGTLIRNYGGAGGGGGFQRVRGLLSALPTTCPIVVGAAGSVGTDDSSNPASTTDGGDGGASTFNVATCRASGGKGGKRAQSNSATVTTQAHGGDGGIGNRSIAGGGADGGLAGTPTALGSGTPGTNGADGTIFNNIGEGGGGGAGGVGKYGGVTCNAATSGGRGSYNPGDTSVYGPADTPDNDANSGAANIVPGLASGAKASPLNGLPTVYGRSGAPGVVVVKLTADVLSVRTTTPPVIPNSIFGAVAKTFVFGKAVSGIKTTPPPRIFLPITFGKDVVKARIKTYGVVARPITFGKDVRAPKQTAIAEISLASHGTPSARTNHSIKVRARTLSGSGGYIKAALYEGSTKRSATLTTTVLGNTLADYTLAIADASAASITSYSNLTIKIWGYDTSGAGLVFEVAKLSLNLPTP